MEVLDRESSSLVIDSNSPSAAPQQTNIAGVALLTQPPSEAAHVLSDEALAFVAGLQRRFNATRQLLLERRRDRQAHLDAGQRPDFLPETASIREDPDWRVAPTLPDLQKRWVEITGPVERKMMINALNSGADVFMADFEDALSPSWNNVVQGQANLIDAVRRALALDIPGGKSYRLNPQIATLMVRPRGWQLDERHLLVDGAPISASLFDFGLYFFHNAQESLQRGTGPYVYLPKLESHLEARLWNDVFVHAQEALGVPQGSVRATVLIETILAAFEMEEILYELRDHAAALNAGRWDYIFSLIKKFRTDEASVLPDRAQISMTVPFMRAYTELLVKTCHRRGAHAIGGMAAFIPSRRDAAVNEVALAKVRDDKQRESGDGFDGTWVAHPDLVPVAGEIFAAALRENDHQKQRLRAEVTVDADALLTLRVPDGAVTLDGLRSNISVALQYLDAWLRGNGAVAIFNLMEDTATAEISRAQLWQWLRHRVALTDGEGTDANVSAELYARIRDEEIENLGGRESGELGQAADLLDDLVMGDDFIDFLTLDAYGRLP